MVTNACIQPWCFRLKTVARVKLSLSISLSISLLCISVCHHEPLNPPLTYPSELSLTSSTSPPRRLARTPATKGDSVGASHPALPTAVENWTFAPWGACCWDCRERGGRVLRCEVGTMKLTLLSRPTTARRLFRPPFDPLGNVHARSYPVAVQSREPSPFYLMFSLRNR